MTPSARSVALALGCASLLSSFTILAHEGGKTENSAYVGDMNKHYETDGFGNCLRTGTWTQDQATCECDPSQAKCQKAEPEPAPVVAAVAPPVVAPVQRDVTIGAGTLFAVNKYDLQAGGKAGLNMLVSDIKNMPSVTSVEVVGHTDSTGAADYNQTLSEKRANAVRDYLVSQGIAPSLISAKGMGETQPVADNATRAGRAKNRRVEIIINGTQHFEQH